MQCFIEVVKTINELLVSRQYYILETLFNG